MNAFRVLAIVTVSLCSCSLQDAAFGKDCDVDDDCHADARDAALLCINGSCLSPDFIAATASGETCVEAIPLALDVRTAGTTGDAINDLSAVCGGADAPDRAYRIDLSSTTNLRVVLEPDGFDGLVFASVDDTCSTFVPGSCVNNAGGTETLSLPGVGPGRVYLVVDGARPFLSTVSGSFHITVSEDGGCEPGFNAVKGRCVGVLKEVEQVVDRTNAAATLLNDGRVLVSGGRSGSSLDTTASAELFDPLTDTFAPTGSMAIDRARHCSQSLDDGRVLVIGGVRGSDNDYVPTPSVEVFDPATGLFSAAPDLPRARDLFTCTQLGGGHGLLVTGGRDEGTTLDDVLVIDPQLNAWTQQAPMLEPRFGHLAFVVDGGSSVLLIGGRVGSAALALDTVESYDVNVGATDAIDTLTSPRAAACGALVDDRHVAVFGGYEGSFDTKLFAQASAEVYDNDDTDWSEVFGELAEPRLFATANEIPGLGIVIAAGSQDAGTASVDLYDPDADGFVALPPLHHARLAHVGVTLNDGRLLLIGGDGGDGNVTVPLSAAELVGAR